MRGRFKPVHSDHKAVSHDHIDLSQSICRDLRLGELLRLAESDEIDALELGYGDTAEGSETLRALIGQRCNMPADQVVTTHGASFALYLVASELAEPGGSAIVAAPYFMQAHSTLLANGWQVTTAENSFDLGYRLNIEGILAALTPNTHLVSIASPQNPSGVSVALNDIARLADALQQTVPEAFLLVDETYREAAYSMEDIIPSAASLSPRIITCSSVSKAYGAPGLRTGWLTLPDDDLRAAIVAAKENIVITDSPFAERMASLILHNAEDILEQQQRRLGPALERVTSWQHSERKRIDWVKPDAGALCCVRIKTERYDDSDVTAFWRLLESRGVSVRPGTMFGSDWRHFRLGFGCVSQDKLEEGLHIISATLSEID